MNLSSLLAIEFELIKKRFSNFEVDYNTIWKEISNIYVTQEGIKTAIDTEKKNGGVSLSKEKRIEKLFRGKNS